LLYGIQPQSARYSMNPGQCKGKAHQPEHLGIAGRRVLVSANGPRPSTYHYVVHLPE
jgi:hypothetical protein